jgi:protein TonB
MTTLQIGQSTTLGEPLWYAYRDTVGTACSVLLLVFLFSKLATPIAEQVERLKEKTLEVSLSEPEPAPQTEPAPARVTPPAPTPVVKDTVRPQTPAQQAPTPVAPAQSPPNPVTATPSVEAFQRAAPAQAAVANSEPTRAAPPTPPVVAAIQPPATAPSTAVQADRYEAQVLRYLESIKRYPSSREARQTRPSGIVTVWFELSRAGKVLDAGIEKGSNSSLLDYEAVKTVRGGNFPPFPESLFSNAEKHRFAAHLKYELKTTE